MDVSPDLNFFSITIGNDIWYSNFEFRFKPDAKDYVAIMLLLIFMNRKRETEKVNAKILEYRIKQVNRNLEELNKK